MGGPSDSGSLIMPSERLVLPWLLMPKREWSSSRSTFLLIRWKQKLQKEQLLLMLVHHTGERCWCISSSGFSDISPVNSLSISSFKLPDLSTDAAAPSISNSRPTLGKHQTNCEKVLSHWGLMCLLYWLQNLEVLPSAICVIFDKAGACSLAINNCW